MIATVTLNPSLDEWVHVPKLQVGELNRAGSFTRYLGGKGINVSRVAHELREPTVAFSFSGGQDGEIFERLLKLLKIPTRLVEIPGSTRNNYKILSDNPRVLTEINTEGPRVPRAAELALEKNVRALKPRPDIIALSGSLPPGMPKSTYARWIRRMRKERVRTVLDSSGEALAMGVRARPWMIKPNHKEAGQVLGRAVAGERQAIAAAREILRMGPEIVLLSLGKDGAILAQGATGLVWRAKAPRVKVDSAVGAGDSVVAGFATGWRRGLAIEEAFRLGVACGTATAMTSGTELCRRRDVEKLYGRVRISRVKR